MGTKTWDQLREELQRRPPRRRRLFDLNTTPEPERTVLPRSPATDEEKELLRRLSRCTFLPGSYDKRFVRDVYNIVAGGYGLTEKQKAEIVRLAQRYRKQLSRIE